MKVYQILFDLEKCTQCHGCETACKSWRDLSVGVRYRRVFTVWSGIYPEVESRGVSLACLHCADPACMAACPVKAIVKTPEDGRVLVDPDRCIRCRACARACPFGIPQFDGDSVMLKCDLCVDHTQGGNPAPCVGTCPNQALAFKEITLEEQTARERVTAKMIEQNA